MMFSFEVFQGRYFTQTAQMAFSLAVLCGQVGLDQVPSHFGAYSPSAHAQNVHVIVLDPLLGREVIVDQPGADSLHLIGTDGCTYAATADGDASLDYARDNCISKRDHEIGLVVAWL
jgi:hypothetical protein